MTPYNGILQLHTEGKNNTEIVRLVGDVSRKTVITVLKLAEEYEFAYPPEKTMTDLEIHRLLHPKKSNTDRVPNNMDTVILLHLHSHL